MAKTDESPIGEGSKNAAAAATPAEEAVTTNVDSQEAKDQDQKNKQYPFRKAKKVAIF